MKRKLSDAEAGDQQSLIADRRMSHHNHGQKRGMKGASKKGTPGKSSNQHRDKGGSPYIVDNKLVPRVRKVRFYIPIPAYLWVCW